MSTSSQDALFYLRHLFSYLPGHSGGMGDLGPYGEAGDKEGSVTDLKQKQKSMHRKLHHATAFIWSPMLALANLAFIRTRMK